MIKNVMIVGHGIMGQGITLSFARGNHQVTVLSRDPSRINTVPDGVKVVAEPPDDPPDMILEAIPEKIELKNELFARLEKAYHGKPILATNTSGLSMESMADKLNYPDRFIGIHYFHPAEAFPTVEVIRVVQTDKSVIGDVIAALKCNGQDAVTINHPISGFLVNRLQHAVLHEAFSMIEKGIVTAESVDRVCKTMFGPRMCVTGLIEQKDISGLATTAATQRNLVPLLDHRGTPTRMIQDMVAKGEVGAKSGKGFYDWSNRDLRTYKNLTADKLTRILEILSE